MSFLSRLSELRIRDVPKLFEPSELGSAVRAFSSNYFKQHLASNGVASGTGRPLIHAAMVLQVIYVLYNYEHEKHYYAEIGERYDSRTSLEEGFKLTGLTGNPLGCWGCPVLKDEHDHH